MTASLLWITSECAVSLLFQLRKNRKKVLVAACVSHSQCPALTQWFCELYNFTLFTGDVCSAMLRVISVGPNVYVSACFSFLQNAFVIFRTHSLAHISYSQMHHVKGGCTGLILH